MNTLCPATVASVSATITTSKFNLIFNLQHQCARPLSPKSRHKLPRVESIGERA
jgi:hypothetical protein